MRRVLLRSAPIWAASILTLAACEREGTYSSAPVETPATETASAAPNPSTDATKDAPSPDPSPSPPPPTEGYEVGASVPTKPAPLASALTTVHAQLEDDVARWLDDGGPLDGELVRRIERAALFQQRIYRKMTRSPRLGRAALNRLARPLRIRAEANFDAGYGLSAGLVPLKPPVRLETTEPESPHRLLVFYRGAERRFEVDWEILAAVNFVETRFGRILGPSSAGALGPMQFLPSTWERYGGGGDILDPRDAILGAARYLRASGALNDPGSALFAYNHSDAYVEAVLTYARQIEARPQAFYEYYFWQVFVRTTKGDMQLTGPGAT